jgi:hypothetical protein
MRLEPPETDPVGIAAANDIPPAPPMWHRPEGAPRLDQTEREAVATALETVALRVRTGELEPRGFTAGMSDAAAVATVLTALLLAQEP